MRTRKPTTPSWPSKRGKRSWTRSFSRKSKLSAQRPPVLMETAPRRLVCCQAFCQTRRRALASQPASQRPAWTKSSSETRWPAKCTGRSNKRPRKLQMRSRSLSKQPGRRLEASSRRSLRLLQTTRESPRLWITIGQGLSPLFLSELKQTLLVSPKQITLWKKAWSKLKLKTAAPCSQHPRSENNS